MKPHLYLALLLPTCLMMSSCVSAWMAASTGVTLKKGMERAVVHRKLGTPASTSTDVMVKTGYGETIKAKFVDTHLYQGKLNSFNEGSVQAMSNALTLGTAEVIMIPMTVAGIKVQKMEQHEVEIAYGADLRLLEYSDNEPLQKAGVPDKSRTPAR